MSTGSIEDNLSAVRARIQHACTEAGRTAESVRLVAVSKTVDIDAVSAALAAGQLEFGENRVQELERKAGCLPERIVWHMIGHLQANKVRAVVRHAAWIHSVDTPVLIERIDRIAGEEGCCPSILLQVNTSGEDSKSGCLPEMTGQLLDAALACEHISCQGLMTMGPLPGGNEETRACFRMLRELRDSLSVSRGIPLPQLSMGMTGDFELAIAEGATMVRIGTAIFGPRK